ncbi:hypothetical protein DFH07DRAFT_1011950 [Mycena maculata]|uniref:Uncharacterized protein n=1 Tax=Mycena maculata TaxID=230809 RepID=A0AAD7HED8_9AGAR|nr:hypothetical protein DFH07DRAFT_1011950 [Mycena maculata]
MPPAYNIDELPFGVEGPDSPTKEHHDLFETRSVVSTTSSTQSSVPPPTMFRGKRILLISVAIFIFLASLLVGLFAQIFVTHEYLRRGQEIITAAPLGPTLAIVHVLTVFLLLTFPFVVGLQSYRLAWAWLKASVDNGHNRPTPFQLGIIMKLLSGANFSALWEGSKYMYGLGSTKRSSYRPPLFRGAMLVLGLALLLVYGFVVLDIALSFASTTISFSQFNEYEGTWPQMSRQINTSMCATSSGAVASGINLCGLEVPGSTPFAASLPEGLRTLTNNSDTNAVAFGNDGTAIIIPAIIPEDISYYGTSYGVLSDCESITSECIGSGPSYGSGSSLTLSCPASASFNAELNASTGAYPFGVLDEDGDQYATPYLVNSNPFNFGGVVLSQAYTSDPDTFVGDTGFFTHSNVAYNVLSCSVTVRSVSYVYFNGTFTIDPSNTMTASDPGITRRIAAMTTAAFLSERIPAAVDGAGLEDGDYASSFGRELSRELIAFTASLYSPDAPEELQRVTPILGSRLSLPVLAVMALITSVYGAFLLFLTASAVLASSASPYTLLARKRLAEPLTAVHAAYARAEPHRTWEQSNQRLFSTETGSDRLSVGPTTSATGGLAFGVSRAVGAPST